MTTDTATLPLLERLVSEHGACWIDQTNANAFTAEAGHRVLFFCGDPVRFPEGLDVAVVLPELRTAIGADFAIGVVRREGDEALALRYGSQRWPSLIFFRDGQYITTLAGMHDWGVYVQRVREALHMPPSRAPGIGIAVVTAGGDAHCH